MTRACLYPSHTIKICNLSYNPNMKPEKYIEQITNARIRIQEGKDAPIMLDGKKIPPPPTH